MVAAFLDTGQRQDMVAEMPTPSFGARGHEGCGLLAAALSFRSETSLYWAMDTNTPNTPFQQAPLSASFKSGPLHEASLGDILVRWPTNRTAPSFSILETQEQLDAAKTEDRNSSAGRVSGEKTGKARYAIIKETGEIPGFFIVSWANLDRNREYGKERAYGAGLFYERTESLTKSFLELQAPAPTRQQAEALRKLLGAVDNCMEVIENKRRLADTSEKMVKATASELLSGKIDQKQAAMYISTAIHPELAVVKAQKNAIDEAQAKIEPSRKSRTPS